MPIKLQIPLIAEFVFARTMLNEVDKEGLIL
jgi:hypothetical protein